MDFLFKKKSRESQKKLIIFMNNRKGLIKTLCMMITVLGDVFYVFTMIPTINRDCCYNQN